MIAHPDSIDVTVTSTSLSKLALSLLNATNSSLCVANARLFTKTIPKIDNPRKLKEKSEDRALYWHGNSGDVVTIRFPALLDRQVAGVKIGRYFDLFTGVTHTDESFGKVRAVIGLRSIPESHPDYPDKVVKAGANAHGVMRRLQQRNEKFHSKYQHCRLFWFKMTLSTSTDHGPPGIKITPFSKNDISGNCFTYLVKTEQLFGSAPSISEEAKIGEILEGNQIFSLLFLILKLTTQFR